MARQVPYGNFNFRVLIDNNEEIGGFAEASGLKSDTKIAEYRAGNAPENHVTKIPGAHSFENLTLKRGVVNSAVFWDWMRKVWTTGPLAKREVIIQLLDEAHNVVQKWKLIGAMPASHTMPQLNGVGGTEVAMEEWQIAFDTLEFEQVGD